MNKSAARLAWPLAVSLALHLGAGWLLSTGAVDSTLRRAKAVKLTVSLARKQQPDPRAAAPAAEAATAPMPGATGAEAAGTLTQRARFLVNPDLAELEDIPVAFPGTVNLRLHVSALGTVDRITVLKSDPVPQDLLAGLLARLEHARLAPALAGSRAVASTVDLVIRYEPGPTPLAPNP